MRCAPGFDVFEIRRRAALGQLFVEALEQAVLVFYREPTLRQHLPNAACVREYKQASRTQHKRAQARARTHTHTAIVQPPTISQVVSDACACTHTCMDGSRSNEDTYILVVEVMWAHI